MGEDIKIEQSSGNIVERLMRFLERLNCEVSIHITWPESEGAEKVIAI